MQNLVEEIKALPIREVAFKLKIEFKRKNSAMCFAGHDKDTPSLNFNDKKNLWYCFACCKGGSNIELVMRALNLDFLSALEWYKKSFNLVSSQQYSKNLFLKKRINVLKKIITKKEVLEQNFYEPNSNIYQFMISKLKLSNIAFEYLKYSVSSPYFRTIRN